MGQKDKLIAQLEDDVRHWQDHCKAVDAICDRYGIPTFHAVQPGNTALDSTRILTEDRVERMIAVVAAKARLERKRPLANALHWLFSKIP